MQNIPKKVTIMQTMRKRRLTIESQDDGMPAVCIKRSIGKYRVPAPNGCENSAYYTDDMQDAMDTCRAMWGDNVYPVIRSVRGI